MPNNDKNYTLDDILAEYEDTAFSESRPSAGGKGFAAAESSGVPAESLKTEEYDNYEDCSEQDISADFSIEPMFAPAEVYPAAEEEEIFADGEDSDGLGELSDVEDGELEALSAGSSETGEPEIIEAEVPRFIGEEFRLDEDFGSSVRDWSAAGIGEEIELPVIAEEIPEAEEKTVEPPTAEEDGNAAEAEDVNDKLVIRVLKAIFPVKGDGVGEIIRKIVFLIAVTVFIGAGIMLASTLLQSREAIGTQESNRSVIATTVATSINEKGEVVTIPPTDDEKAQHNFDVAEYYKNINEEYIGYLEVEGCKIYEPVVQGEDNEKYLRTTIYGGTNKAGTIFADHRCVISKEYTSPNIILYGHNQEDRTMFGSLKEYKQNVEFYRENPVVKFNPEFENGEYLIYGFFVTHVREDQDSNGIVFHYQDYIETLNDEATFNWYIGEVMKRNQIVSPVDVEFGDKLLCLSTCSNEFTDSRFVVFARKLRDGESAEDFDFDKAYLNPRAQGVDWDAITSGDVTEEDTDETEEEIDESAGKTIGKRNLQTEITRLVGGETEAAATAADTEETSAPETTKRKKKTTAETTVAETETETADTGEETSVPEESETEDGSETAVPDGSASGSESGSDA